jgi:hypothetical protein
MSERKRKNFTSQYKTKVAIEAIRGVKTTNEIAQEFGVHPTQVGEWKRELLKSTASMLQPLENVYQGVARASNDSHICPFLAKLGFSSLRSVIAGVRAERPARKPLDT